MGIEKIGQSIVSTFTPPDTGSIVKKELAIEESQKERRANQEVASKAQKDEYNKAQEYRRDEHNKIASDGTAKASNTNYSSRVIYENVKAYEHEATFRMDTYA